MKKLITVLVLFLVSLVSEGQVGSPILPYKKDGSDYQLSEIKIQVMHNSSVMNTWRDNFYRLVESGLKATGYSVSSLDNNLINLFDSIKVEWVENIPIVNSYKTKDNIFSWGKEMEYFTGYAGVFYHLGCRKAIFKVKCANLISTDVDLVFFKKFIEKTKKETSNIPNPPVETIVAQENNYYLSSNSTYSESSYVDDHNRYYRPYNGMYYVDQYEIWSGGIWRAVPFVTFNVYSGKRRHITGQCHSLPSNCHREYSRPKQSYHPRPQPSGKPGGAQIDNNQPGGAPIDNGTPGGSELTYGNPNGNAGGANTLKSARTSNSSNYTRNTSKYTPDRNSSSNYQNRTSRYQQSNSRSYQPRYQSSSSRGGNNSSVIRNYSNNNSSPKSYSSGGGSSFRGSSSERRSR